MYSRHLCSGTGEGAIGQSRVICQVLCSGIQVISPLVLGGPLIKVGSSAKFCVVVFKSPLLWYWGGSIDHSRVICQVLCSGMQVISALVPGGFIGKNRVICHVLCSGIQVTSALVLGGSID